VGVLIVVIAAAAGLLAWVVRKRPSTAAPLGATGLAVAAIKNADHLSRLGRFSFGLLLILFALVVAALLFFCFMQRGNSSAKDTEETGGGNGEDEKKVVESPLNITFSLAVLLWAAIIVAYRAEKPPSPTKGSTPTAGQTVSEKLLSPVSGFQPYSSDVSKISKQYPEPISTLMSEVSMADPKPGDLLLLLGSADCTAIRKRRMTNGDLALYRAAAVQKILQDQLRDSVRIEAKSLHQHESCSQSEDLRAVFPVLIQAKTLRDEDSLTGGQKGSF
jgi:preprotein translocase subunit SecG